MPEAELQLDWIKRPMTPNLLKFADSFVVKEGDIIMVEKFTSPYSISGKADAIRLYLSGGHTKEFFTKPAKEVLEVLKQGTAFSDAVYEWELGETRP